MATQALKPLSHILFTGVTMSGKTTAARVYSRAFCAHRIPVLVYDPVETATAGGGWGDGAQIFNTPETFLKKLAETGPCKIFIDEAADIFSLREPQNFWIATRGRHFGWQLFIITQRPMMIAPTVRNQCGEAYIFRLTSADLGNIGSDFGHDLRPYRLDTGDYLHLVSGSARFTRGNVFSDKGKLK